MTLNSLKSKKKFISYSIILVLLICVLLGIKYKLYKKSYQGPLFALTGVEAKDFTSASQIAPPRTPVVLGGFPFKTNGESLTIKSISLSNVPKNLKVGSSGMFVSDPEIVIATESWFKKMTNHPVHSLPMILTSHSKYWEPEITVTPLKSGTYVINGLIITYQIGNKQYQDYFRDQFVICAEKGDAPCKEPPPPPISP